MFWALTHFGLTGCGAQRSDFPAGLRMKALCDFRARQPPRAVIAAFSLMVGLR